ncbi:MAG: hypothetical protein ACRC57_04160 [Sarcina sp.]
MIDIIFILLPLIIIGITLILFIKNYNTRILSINLKNHQLTNSATYMSLGMSFGILGGMLIGSFFISKIGIIAISYGISIGVLGGMFIGSLIKK